MRNLLKLIAGISILCIGTISFAAVAPTPALMGDSAASIGTGAYIGLQAGIGKMDIKDIPSELKPMAQGHSEDIGGYAGRLFGGYLWESSAWRYGVEIGGMTYSDNEYKLKKFLEDGDLDNINLEYKGYLIDVLAVLKYCFNAHWDIVGKVGAAYVSQEFSAKFEDLMDPKDSGKFNKTESAIDPEAQLSMEYLLNRNWNFDLTALQVFGDQPDSFLSDTDENIYKKVASVSAIMLSATYHFN